MLQQLHVVFGVDFVQKILAGEFEDDTTRFALHRPLFWRFVRELRCGARIGLAGTPVLHRIWWRVAGELGLDISRKIAVRRVSCCLAIISSSCSDRASAGCEPSALTSTLPRARTRSTLLSERRK